MEAAKTSEIRRTGWTTAARMCPAHDLPLELELDVTEHPKSTLRSSDPEESRLRWRCQSCAGAWTETYFMDDAAWARQVAMQPRLVLPCPACNGLRVTHSCTPACCPAHHCLD